MHCLAFEASICVLAGVRSLRIYMCSSAAWELMLWVLRYHSCTPNTIAQWFNEAVNIYLAVFIILIISAPAFLTCHPTLPYRNAYVHI